MTMGVLELLMVRPTVRQVSKIMVITPQSPRKDDPDAPAFKFGLAPNRSNHSIPSQSLLNAFLGSEILTLVS